MKQEQVKQQSFKVNALFSIIFQIFKIIVPFITTPYIARVLGNNNVGEYSYAYSIVYIFITISAFGFSDYGNLKISQNRSNKYQVSKTFYEIMISKAILTTLSIGIYLALTFSVSDLYNSLPLFLTLISFLISVLIDSSFLLMGTENYKTIAIRDFIIKIISTVLIFTIIRDSSYTSLITYALILGGSNLLSSLLICFSIKKHLTRVQLKDLNLFLCIKESSIFFIPLVVSSIYLNFNKTLVGLITNNSLENANYEQSTKTINFVTTTLCALNNLITSRIANIYAEKGYNGIRKKVDDVLHLIIALAIPSFFGIILINVYFVNMFFGDGYQGTATLIYYLSPNLITIPICYALLSSYFVPTNKRGKANIVNIIIALTDLVLCLCLIPFIGAKGACIAFSVAEILQLIGFILLSKGDINWFNLLKISIKPFICSLVMFALGLLITYFIKDVITNDFVICLILVGSCSIIYTCLLFLLRDKLLLEQSKSMIDKVKSKLKK